MQPSFTIAIGLFLLCQAAIACPDEKNCMMCLEGSSAKNSMCQVCQNSFFDIKNMKCNDNLPIVVPNCFNYFPPNYPTGICFSCNPGYQVNAAYDSCVRCTDENCAFCKGETCSACFNGFITGEDGTCDTNSKCKAQNCSICLSDRPELCVRCSPGYVSVSNTRQCVKGPSNCLVVKEKGDTKCLSCSYGYYILSDGSCKSDDEIHRISLDIDGRVSEWFNFLADALVPVM
jgi:hypothetical protein